MMDLNLRNVSILQRFQETQKEELEDYNFWTLFKAVKKNAPGLGVLCEDALGKSPESEKEEILTTLENGLKYNSLSSYAAKSSLLS